MPPPLKLLPFLPFLASFCFVSIFFAAVACGALGETGDPGSLAPPPWLSSFFSSWSFCHSAKKSRTRTRSSPTIKLDEASSTAWFFLRPATLNSSPLPGGTRFSTRNDGSGRSGGGDGASGGSSSSSELGSGSGSARGNGFPIRHSQPSV
jgi:hypothetical protein